MTALKTFREVHGGTFQYGGKRSIVFPVRCVVPEKELKQCVSMSLRYHSFKHLPLLGA